MALPNYLDVTDDSPAQRLFSNLITNEDSVPLETPDPLSQLFPATVQITPQPGFCLKTRELSGEKVFVNICHCDTIPAPPPKSEEDLKKLLDSTNDLVDYKVPLSIGPLHREVDKGGEPCQAYDVIINTEFFLQQVARSDIFTEFIIQVAMQGLEEKYKLAYKEENSWVKLKNKKYFGTPTPHSIQDRSKSPFTKPSSSSEPTKSRPLIEDITDTTALKVETSKNKGSLSADHKPEPKPQRFQVIDKEDREVPPYKVYLFPATGYPTHLKYLIELPRIKQASHLVLEVCPNRLQLTSFCYQLDLDLPYLVMKDAVQALFNSATHVLLVTLPIIPSSKQD